jgi:ATP-binding protein involved in chromosome partitioning
MNLIDYRIPLIRERIKNINRVIIVGSGKGGVGKSLISYSIAKALSEKKLNVGVLDLDLHGPVQHILSGIKEYVKSDNKGLKPINANNIKIFSLGFIIGNNPLPLKGEDKYNLIMELLANIDWGLLDYLIIDLPPGTGDEFLAINKVLSNKGELLIITTPSELSLDVVKRLITLAIKEGVKILGIVINMSRLKYGNKWIKIFGDINHKDLENMLNCKILGEIPFDPNVNKNITQAKLYWKSIESLISNL